MAETRLVLAQADPMATTLTDFYTVPGATQVVCSTLVVANRSAVATTFRLSVAVAGAVDATKQYIAYDAAIAGNTTVSFTIGITLGAADVVRVYATLATLSFNLFGVTIA